MHIRIGADPEVFVVHKGKPVSAHDMIPGTKDEPHPVDNGAVQVDGMALEFNIDPADTRDEFVNNVASVMQSLENMIPKGHKLDISPVATFGREYIDEQPEKAKELGCDPDYNAYTRRVNPRPDGGGDFRTAAGHIHIGWGTGFDIADPKHFATCCHIVKELDWFLAMPARIYEKGPKAGKRRKLYGAPGAFRPKSYGVEYRVLSNFWLKKEELTQWVYDQTHLCLNHLLEGHRSKYSINGNADYGLKYYSKRECLAALNYAGIKVPT